MVILGNEKYQRTNLTGRKQSFGQGNNTKYVKILCGLQREMQKSSEKIEKPLAS